MSNCCWDEWKRYFENEGFNCIAPAWPHKDATAEELRNNFSQHSISSISIHSLTEYFADTIEQLSEKPILIGHSLGGLIAQVLLQRGLGFAAVAIHSFPPGGVWSFAFLIRGAMWEATSRFTLFKKTYLIPFSTWRYTIASGLGYDQQRDLYYQYAIPESKKLLREAFGRVTKIDFKKSRGPLLLTSGSNDKLVPASVNYRNYKRYANEHSITAYVEFKGHNHLVFQVPEWKQQADCILQWIRGIE
jgi:pimeloyl-ACP methyl ester carboxylesterase